MLVNANLFDSFTPLGMSYQWIPGVLWLNVIPDAVIALICFVLPGTLWYLMRRRSDVPFKAGINLFCVFILACGVNHAISIFTVWGGYFGVQGLLKAATAVVALITFVVIYPLIPRLLALRDARELEQANKALQSEIDIRNETELQTTKLQSELAHLNRVSTVGQMATGLAHELNQPMLAISTSVDAAVLVAKAVPQNRQILFDCLSDIQSETLRASQVISSLREFVGARTTAREFVDINSVVKEAVRLVACEATAVSVELVYRETRLPEVEADRVQIVQVLVNLLRNSIEAISAAGAQVDDKKEIVVEAGYDGSEIFVSVTDSGPGIPSGFDPFAAFGVNKSSGMGVGLSISREIIESHGGCLIHKNVVSGACFILRIPADDKHTCARI